MADQRTVDVGEVRLAYRVSGPPGAPPLVLLHALGEDSTDWDGVAPVLARERRVYAVDLRGHGRSDWPGVYSLELMRADVLRFMDTLGPSRVDLVGHSMGGIVAYLLAEEQPQRVLRLVLEDVAVPRPREPTTPSRPPGELAFDWEMVLAVRKQVDTPDPVWLERLGRITARTLVVGGGSGSHVPQGGVAEFARRIPGSRVITVPVGHLIHAMDPQAFLAAVAPFLLEEPREQGEAPRPATSP